MVPNSLTIAKKRREPGVSRGAQPRELEGRALKHAKFRLTPKNEWDQKKTLLGQEKKPHPLFASGILYEYY
jgi:hypothetical protein